MRMTFLFAFKGLCYYSVCNALTFVVNMNSSAFRLTVSARTALFAFRLAYFLFSYFQYEVTLFYERWLHKKWLSIYNLYATINIARTFGVVKVYIDNERRKIICVFLYI